VTDPVIQPLQIARALVARLGVLIEESKERARGHLDVGQLELRIGEAQQMYPEIWRHLDTAAAILRERGVDVVAYEKLRAKEAGILGVTDVVATNDLDWGSLAGGSLRAERVKSATFNVEGRNRAQRGCGALMRACPDIDWGALDRADAAQIAAAGSLTATRWLPLAIGLAVVGAAIGIAVLVHG
jgi:hypothetical protein